MKASIHKLKTPVQSLGKTNGYLQWYAVNYPLTNTVYWSLCETANGGKGIAEGSYILPEEVLETWGTDDSVIPKHLETIKVWEG